MPSDVTLETEEGEINPFSGMPTSDPFLKIMMQDMQDISLIIGVWLKRREISR